MKQDIDNRSGERVVREGGQIKFYGEVYKNRKLEGFIGFPVIVKGYGYTAVDVFLVERKNKNKWGRGQFLCLIEKKDV